MYTDSSLTLPALVEALESLVFWYTLGLRLGLPSHELDIIERDYRGNNEGASPHLLCMAIVVFSLATGVKDQKVALCKLWLEMDLEASWSKVCDALWKEKKRVLATQLRERYITGRARAGCQG